MTPSQPLSRPEVIRRKLKELDELWPTTGPTLRRYITERRRVLNAELVRLGRKEAA